MPKYLCLLASFSAIYKMMLCFSRSLGFLADPKQPVKFFDGAEILAAGKTIDEGIMLRLGHFTFIPIDINFTLFIDLRNLFNSLSTFLPVATLLTTLSALMSVSSGTSSSHDMS